MSQEKEYDDENTKNTIDELMQIIIEIIYHLLVLN
jgi:hypothetical protein